MPPLLDEVSSFRACEQHEDRYQLHFLLVWLPPSPYTLMPDTHRRKNQQNFLSMYYVPGPESHSCLLNRFSRVRLFATLWTLALQAPLSLGFSRQEYWSGLPCPPPGHLSGPGIKPAPLMSPALVGRFSITSTTRETRESPSTCHILFNHHDKCRGVFLLLPFSK